MIGASDCFCNKLSSRTLKANKFPVAKIFDDNFTVQEPNNAISKLKTNKVPKSNIIFAEFILRMGHNSKSTLLHLQVLIFFIFKV